MAQSGVEAARRHFPPRGAAPARPRGAGGTSSIAPHPRSRPPGSFGKTRKKDSFISNGPTQLAYLPGGPVLG